MKSRQSEPDTCIPLLIYPTDLSLSPITQANEPHSPRCLVHSTAFPFSCIIRAEVHTLVRVVPRNAATTGARFVFEPGFRAPLTNSTMLIYRGPGALPFFLEVSPGTRSCRTRELTWNRKEKENS